MSISARSEGRAGQMPLNWDKQSLSKACFTGVDACRKVHGSEVVRGNCGDDLTDVEATC